MSQASASFYQLHESEDTRLTSNEKRALENFFKDLENRLPSKMKNALSPGVQVEFQNLAKAQGKAVGTKRLILNSTLRTIILKGEQNSAPAYDSNGRLRSHGTEFKEAQATVVHETLHLYDFKNVRTDQEKSFIQNCQMMAQDPQMPLADQCEVYLNTNTTLSTDPYYLEVAGWPLATQGKNFRESKNTFSKRSADVYEFKDAREHAAVNFEYFILDPEFACRKPTLANFFSSHFGYRPYSQTCDSSFYIDPSASQPSKLIKSIPFDRVYQIHYLHADRGQEAMSRWGHSMYRVVICAPERETVGPECLKDEYYHLVLSFRAFVNTYGISSWKGLTGQYPSRLFFVPLEEVKQNYNVDEFRDLHSYPLNLSRAEMISFLKRALETHWNYDSSYYFLSNNCASESLNLLRASVLRSDLIDQKLIKPTDLRDLLIKKGLIDVSTIPKDRTEAFNRGYIFINHSERYIKALSEITGQNETPQSVTKHLDSDFKNRAEVYRKTGSETLKKLAAQVILETAALNRAKARARSSVFSKALQAWKSGSVETWVQDLKNSLDQSLNYFSIFSAPYEFLSSDTYGAPLRSELETNITRIEKVWDQNRKLVQNRNDQINHLFTDEQMTEVAMTEKNLSEIQIKMISQAKGLKLN